MDRHANQQLLFHLVFGYQIVRALLVLSANSTACRAPPSAGSRRC